MEDELALNDADPSNEVSKKCKHGVKTLVDTIVDQPCQYGNVGHQSQHQCKSILKSIRDN